MKVLIDILHPAHVHFFRYVIRVLEERGVSVLLTAREKDVTRELLDAFGFDYEVLSSIGTKKTELLREFAVRTSKLNRIVQEEAPDVLVGVMGVSVAPVGRLNRIPTLVIYGTESARLSNRWVYALADEFLTPESFRIDLGRKHTRYPGTPELSYLSPRYFEPDRSVLDLVGLSEKDRFTIVRFVAWGASHDIGHPGISPEDKSAIIEELQMFGPVFVSSESKLPDDLAGFELDIPPSQMHSLVSFASLLIGESATMAAEAAALGVPAAYIDNVGRGFTDYLEYEFGLVKTFPESAEGVSRATEWAAAQLTRDSAERGHEPSHERLLRTNPDLPKYLAEKIMHHITRDQAPTRSL